MLVNDSLVAIRYWHVEQPLFQCAQGFELSGQNLPNLPQLLAIFF
jgi:hypothetical protein